MSMTTKVDLTGREFNYWTALYHISTMDIYTTWWCRCKCGVEKTVRAIHLTSNASRSCGCAPRATRTHGHGRRVNGKLCSKKYATWRYIKARCTDIKHKNYELYKGKMDSRWLDFRVFNQEVPDPPVPVKGVVWSIDRIDNNKGYEPGNVRWVTTAEQHRNQSNNRWITYKGEVKLLTDWAASLGMNPTTLHVRIRKYGLLVAFSTPLGKRIAPAINKKYHTVGGITDCVVGWGIRLNVHRDTIRKWVKNGKLQSVMSLS